MTDPANSGSSRLSVLSALSRKSGFALFALVARSLGEIASLVITLLAARFLLPSEFGMYSVAMVFITLIQTMTYAGYYQFIVTSRDDDSAVLSTCFWAITGLAALAAALLIAAAYPLSLAFKATELTWVLIMLAALQPFAAFGAWSSATLLRHQDVRTHFSIMFTQNLAALVGGAALLIMWQSIFALVAYRALRIFTGALLYLFFIPSWPRFQFDRALARKATSFAGGLYGSRFLKFMSRYSADLLLGLAYSTTETGLYRFGSRVASGATDVISQPMSSFALTQFGYAAREGKELEKPLERFAGTTILLVGIVAAVLIVFGRDIVSTLFKPAYLDALTVTYAVAMSAVLRGMTRLVEPTMAARGRTGVVMLFNLVAAALSILAVVLALPFGLQAVAWSQTAVAAVLGIVALAVIRKYGEVKIRGAVRSLAVALSVILLFGAVLEVLWRLIQSSVAGQGAAIIVGLGAALVLALATLVLGRKLRVFTLNAFSG